MVLQFKEKEIKGSLPLDYRKACTYTDRDAQKLVAQAFFDLFDKVKPKVKHFDFEGLKKAMLNAIEVNPSFAPKSRFRVYSDHNIPTGDIPEFSKALAPTKYGKEIKKLFVHVGLFKNPYFRAKTNPSINEDKKILRMTIVSELDVNLFASELDRI